MTPTYEARVNPDGTLIVWQVSYEAGTGQYDGTEHLVADTGLDERAWDAVLTEHGWERRDEWWRGSHSDALASVRVEPEERP